MKLPPRSSYPGRLRATVSLALALTALPACAQWNQLLFSDNFYTGLTPAASTTDLNYNIGLAGGRQGGYLVTDVNPAGFGWSLHGKTSFNPNNGWDLRAQNGFPATGPIDPYTLRYRDDAASEWSTLSPDIGFNSVILNNSYRIQAQLLHVHLDGVPVNDRWMGVTFGAQPAVRFPNVVDNAGVILFASGAYQIFSDGALVGAGGVPLSPNGAFEMDIRVLNNVGAVYINGVAVSSGLDFSGVTPAWVGLTSLSGVNPAVSTLTQFRFDNFAVSTIPEPSAIGLAGLALALLWRRRARRG